MHSTHASSGPRDWPESGWVSLAPMPRPEEAGIPGRAGPMGDEETPLLFHRGAYGSFNPH